MTRKFNDPELQKLWEEYEDYLADHSGQAYYCMPWSEWRIKHGK
ncbi:MAG: hypothetical protein AABY22_20265 [Nanoarchaeota archaeon]